MWHERYVLPSFSEVPNPPPWRAAREYVLVQCARVFDYPCVKLGVFDIKWLLNELDAKWETSPGFVAAVLELVRVELEQSYVPLQMYESSGEILDLEGPYPLCIFYSYISRPEIRERVCVHLFGGIPTLRVDIFQAGPDACSNRDAWVDLSRHYYSMLGLPKLALVDIPVPCRDGLHEILDFSVIGGGREPLVPVESGDETD